MSGSFNLCPLPGPRLLLCSIFHLQTEAMRAEKGQLRPGNHSPQQCRYKTALGYLASAGKENKARSTTLYPQLQSLSDPTADLLLSIARISASPVRSAACSPHKGTSALLLQTEHASILFCGRRGTWLANGSSYRIMAQCYPCCHWSSLWGPFIAAQMQSKRKSFVFPIPSQRSVEVHWGCSIAHVHKPLYPSELFCLWLAYGAF